MRGDAQYYAEQIGEFRRQLAGVVRRMTVRITSGGIWQLAGHLLFSGTQRETREIELFPGIGIYARPPKGSSSAEAITINAGGQNNPAIIATRDEATRQKVDDVSDDESAMYNSVARVYVKADGSVEIRTHGGTAIKLPTFADVQKIKTAIAGAAVVALDGGASLKATILAGLASSLGGVSGLEPWPVGTTKLKAE